jgi:zinc transport system ATP-binding protein
LIAARQIAVSRLGKSILADVDLSIGRREIVTLIGPNGAGKTTLVRVLLGLERPDGGTVTRKPGLVVGYVPQRFDVDAAIPLTVERFLGLGRRTDPQTVRSALEEVGARGLVERQYSELSGGELQRILLARALLRNPDLLVLDEPVRGLDYAGEAEFYKLIGHLRTERNLGVLLVSHDLHIVMAQSDRIVCLNSHVCCSGAPQSVAEHPEYRKLFGSGADRLFAVYQHDHDHEHDLSGAPLSHAGRVGETKPRGNADA